MAPEKGYIRVKPKPQSQNATCQKNTKYACRARKEKKNGSANYANGK